MEKICDGSGEDPSCSRYAFLVEKGSLDNLAISVFAYAKIQTNDLTVWIEQAFSSVSDVIRQLRSLKYAMVDRLSSMIQ